MNPGKTLLAVALLALATAAAHAAPRPPQKVVTIEGISEYRLDNGLRVLLFPDPSNEKVTVNVTYLVGSRHEGYGESGMAHLLEHMVFKGTKIHGNIMDELHKHGADFNGSTSFDRTNYFETLPASPESLKWAVELESDRMVSSRIAKEDLAKEFSVVRNEFEAGENQPEGVLEERMFSSAYLWHNYGKSTIGSKVDIERVPADSLRSFYQRYYQPDNAVLVIAGKFDVAATLDLVQRTFGQIPRPSRALSPTYTVEPVQDGERDVVLRRAGDVAVAGVMYHGVAGADRDMVAEEALVDLLTNKPSGRLYKALVDKGLAARLTGDASPTYDPGMIEFFANVRADQPVEKVRDTMISMIEGLGATKITDAEVERFKVRRLKQIELAMTSSQRVGILLSEFAAIGDWRMMFIHRDRVAALTTADVQRVASTYLRASNRTRGTFMPTKTPDRAPLPPQVDVAQLVKDYKGQAAMSEGEAFAATVDNVEKRTTRTALPSGLKLALLSKKTRGKAVKVVLAIHSGSEKELKGHTTAADLVLPMLMRGSKKHSFEQLKDEFDRLKADVRAGNEGRGGALGMGEPGAAMVRITTVHENLSKVLDLVAEVVEQPAFPKEQFETLRKEMLSQLEEQLQDPQALAFSTLMRKVAPWPKDDVRYVPTVQEQIDRLRVVKLQDVVAYYTTHWGGSSAEILIVGDFDPAEVKSSLEKSVGAWRMPKPFQRIARPFVKAAVGPEDVIDTPDKQMAIVGVAGGVEVRDDDPDYATLQLVNHVLGGGTRSRLFDRLRQKDGLSYGAYFLRADPFERSGALVAFAICAPQNAEKAMRAMREEVGKLVKDAVPAPELTEAKKSFQLEFDNQMASDDFLAAQLNRGLYLGRTLEYNQKINTRVQSLTPTDVATALSKHVQPDQMVRVRAGDLKAQKTGSM